MKWGEDISYTAVSSAKSVHVLKVFNPYEKCMV